MPVQIRFHAMFELEFEMLAFEWRKSATATENKRSPAAAAAVVASPRETKGGGSSPNLSLPLHISDHTSTVGKTRAKLK